MDEGFRDAEVLVFVSSWFRRGEKEGRFIVCGKQ